MILYSPVSGRALRPEGPHALVDGAGERWPVVDGIPFLRAGREALVAATLGRLDAGKPDEALVLLLADQDDWWTGPATDADQLRLLARRRDEVNLREAMALLRFGPVADYFAFRWSDPTYLAGLSLLEAHWPEPATAFELACGIGHYLRELTMRGVACVGVDIVFAKCWLAKHWVAPHADYLVFDAAHPWSVRNERYDLVMCHDAFYFLADQATVADRLRTLLAPDGVLAITHLHNGEYRNGAKGPARTVAEWASLFPGAAVYDEDDLLRSLLRADVPQTVGWIADNEIEAFSLVEGGAEASAVSGGVAMPPQAANLRRNPLLGDRLGHDAVRWPSERYRDEYAARCFWANKDEELEPAITADPARLRRTLHLPERW